MTDSTYHVIELIGSSSDSWELAAQNAVREAARMYRDLRVAEVVEMDVLIESGDVIAYRTKLRLSYKACLSPRQLARRASPPRPGRVAAPPPPAVPLAERTRCSADPIIRIAFAWRDLRRGAATAVVRDRMFGTGRDAVEPAQMDVLDLLVVQDDRRMSDLAAGAARRSEHRHAHVAADGGVRVSPPGAHSEDGRVVTVRLTDEGRRRHALVAGRRTAILRTILEPFDEADRATLASLLDRFLVSLEKYVGDGAPL